MSFDLGDWANQLTCEMCDDGIEEDLGIDDPNFNGGLPDSFWDEPPDPPDSGFELELPDYYPSAEPKDGGWMFYFNGSF